MYKYLEEVYSSIKKYFCEINTEQRQEENWMHLGTIRLSLALQVNAGVIWFILYDKLMQHPEIEINKSPVLRNVHTLLLNQSLAAIPLAHMKKCPFVF